MDKIFWNLLKRTRQFFIYRVLKLETSGVRVILCKNNSILLIKHRYDDFWVLPGGGIKTNEKPKDAAIREILEETNIKILNLNSLVKLGIYLNNQNRKKDLVHVFTSKNNENEKHQWDEMRGKKCLLGRIEVKKQGWFSVSQLPKISLATKKRLSEFFRNDYQNLTIRKW